MPGEQEFDVGLGTGGPATMRMLIDTTQLVNPGISDIAHSMPVAQAANGYWTVGAGSTAATLGATGATGDYIAGVWLVPTGTTLSPGAVSIKDGVAGVVITLFNGGTSSISNAVPWLMYLGFTSNNGGWKLTTGAGMQAIGIGKFT